MTSFLFCLLFPTSVMLSHFHVLWTIAANEIYVMHTSCALIVQCLFTLTFFFSYFSLFSVIDNRQENGLALFFLFSFSLLTNWQLALKEASKDGNRIEERKKERLHVACYLSVCELEKIGSGNRQFLFFFCLETKTHVQMIQTFLVDCFPCKFVHELTLADWHQQQLLRETNCKFWQPAILQQNSYLCVFAFAKHTHTQIDNTKKVQNAKNMARF